MPARFQFSHHSVIAGKTTAWAESRLFGAYIPAHSWFSCLQSASMEEVGRKVGAGIGVDIGVVIGLLGGLCFCGGR
ncbi:hypothetical protein FIBSPDRAFT_866369 [Athelia psychrophila]|uniref:Uncharacterized protein n=1 Tax=Athelia psychrophila TaxID=1759441 RepID=A0A166EUU0_9AGAM|nr:hypothetical protein FIBSPDRAFT_866369 [Fibularhizoctonia sp. CBS 109695]